MPTGREAPAEGRAAFAIDGDRIPVKTFDLTGGGLSLSGYGDVWLDGRLALTIVAMGAPGEGPGIPIVSPALGWVMRAVQRELVRLEVSGTIQQPHFKSTVLSKIKWPLTSLRDIVVSPVLGGAGSRTNQK